MMKKLLLTFFLALSIFLSNTAVGQSAQQIGFVNSNEILAAMPEKAQASATLNDLNNKYKAEFTVMQNDYNKKYSDFISYQTSMAESIRIRRMQELKELENKINDFMKIAQEDVEAQENILLTPLRQKVKDTIYQVGVEKGLICVYDLANPTIVFVTPDATNITPLVKEKLGIKEEKK